MAKTQKEKKGNLKETKSEDLAKKLMKLEEDLQTIRFKAEGAKSKNVKEALTIRKDIARILTEINSR